MSEHKFYPHRFTSSAQTYTLDGLIAAGRSEQERTKGKKRVIKPTHSDAFIQRPNRPQQNDENKK